MDAMEAILNRRSIRKYSSKPVSDELVKELVRAGMSAPSAGNEQPWHFVIINNHKILKQIPKFHPYSKMLEAASLAILVCGDEELEKHKGFWIQDCAAATENILIAAQANGLGTVWLGIFPREERIDGMKKLLEIPHHIIPFSLISIGYPAEQKPPSNRFNPSRIHYNVWQ